MELRTAGGRPAESDGPASWGHDYVYFGRRAGRIRGIAIVGKPGPVSGANRSRSSVFWGPEPARQVPRLPTQWFFGDFRNPRNVQDSPNSQNSRSAGSCAAERVASLATPGAAGVVSEEVMIGGKPGPVSRANGFRSSVFWGREPAPLGAQ